MFIYQDGKLYAQTGENELIGVEIYSDKTLCVEGTETKLGTDYDIFTPVEVYAKFGIHNGESYVFPVEKDSENSEKENVITDDIEEEKGNNVDEEVVPVKPTRKRTAK